MRVYLTCDESVTGTPKVTTDGDSLVTLSYVRESLSAPTIVNKVVHYIVFLLDLKIHTIMYGIYYIGLPELCYYGLGFISVGMKLEYVMVVIPRDTLSIICIIRCL